MDINWQPNDPRPSPRASLELVKVRFSSLPVSHIFVHVEEIGRSGNKMRDYVLLNSLFSLVSCVFGFFLCLCFSFVLGPTLETKECLVRCTSTWATFFSFFFFFEVRVFFLFLYFHVSARETDGSPRKDVMGAINLAPFTLS